MSGAFVFNIRSTWTPFPVIPERRYLLQLGLPFGDGAKVLTRIDFLKDDAGPAISKPFNLHYHILRV